MNTQSKLTSGVELLKQDKQLLEGIDFKVQTPLPSLGTNDDGGNAVEHIQVSTRGWFSLYLGLYNPKAETTPLQMVAKVVRLNASTVAQHHRTSRATTSLGLVHQCLVTTFAVKLVPNQQSPSKLIILSEYAPLGSLLDLLLRIRPQPMSESEARQCYVHFGNGLQYLHHNGLAHHNLKCEKILLCLDSQNKDQVIYKLADYCLTRSAFPVNQRQPLLEEQTYCACAAYQAPEVLLEHFGGNRQSSRRPYNQFRADVWSAGVVLYAMVHGGRLPFRQWNLRLWLIAQLETRFSVQSTLSDALQRFIRLQLTPLPDHRPDMDALLLHPWIEQ